MQSSPTCHVSPRQRPVKALVGFAAALAYDGADAPGIALITQEIPLPAARFVHLESAGQTADGRGALGEVAEAWRGPEGVFRQEQMEGPELVTGKVAGEP